VALVVAPVVEPAVAEPVGEDVPVAPRLEFTAPAPALVPPDGAVEDDIRAPLRGVAVVVGAAVVPTVAEVEAPTVGSVVGDMARPAASGSVAFASAEVGGAPALIEPDVDPVVERVGVPVPVD
jgi:hypothetical protein